MSSGLEKLANSLNGRKNTPLTDAIRLIGHIEGLTGSEKTRIRRKVMVNTALAETLCGFEDDLEGLFDFCKEELDD